MKRALLLLSLLASACGSTETYSVLLRPPVPVDAAAVAAGRHVDTFPEGRAPQQPFFEVALVQVVGRGQSATALDVVNAMRSRASELGCDAITRLRVDQGVSMAHGYGVCIRYAASGSSSVSPPPAGLPAAASPAAAPTPDDGTVHL